MRGRDRVGDVAPMDGGDAKGKIVKGKKAKVGENWLNLEPSWAPNSLAALLGDQWRPMATNGDLWHAHRIGQQSKGPARVAMSAAD